MNDRVRLSLDLLYVAIENLSINVSHETGRDLELDHLLALATDMKDAITECWRTLYPDAIEDSGLGDS